MRVGHNQLRILVMLGSPTMALVVPGPETRSMVKNGLLKEREPGAMACITPKGLRVLADEMEKGRVADALTRMRLEAAARRESAARQKRKASPNC